MKILTIGTKYWIGDLKPPTVVGADKPKNQPSEALVRDHEKQPSVGQTSAPLEPMKPIPHRVGSALCPLSDKGRETLNLRSELRKLDIFDVRVGVRGQHFVRDRTLAKLVFLKTTHSPLYSLGATLPGCGLSPRHLKEISTLLGKHKHSLDRVALVMPKSGYGNFFVDGNVSQYTESRANMAPLFNGLTLLRNLKTLKLNLNASAFLEFDQSLTALAKAVRHMPKLRDLSLGISRNSFPDKVMGEFFYNLTYQDELETLALNISRSGGIVGTTLCDAWVHVSKIESLKKLTLDVSRIDKFDDKVVDHLGLALLGLKELKELNLKINATRCTTEGIEIMLSAARELKQLGRLTIHAAGCGAVDHHRAKQLFTEFAERPGVVANINFVGDKLEFGLRGPHE
ncbi:leucine-rich repeat domain-containing protein [Pandoraea sputorum]|uniref:Ran GTPase-activating protein (RanGAP) involved in mRNA processing and transport n=1 Tax=Pandoraea sputorum TaxID=93222 RepID=A0A5E5BKJ4_9BURK|nr:hypothetical protein [Pandoraea sputorum]VVE85786.1 hypothetical protein PSP31121_05418 [Pandoraea sputorum]